MEQGAEHRERELRVLIVEDLPADAEFNEREVRQVLPGSVFKRVEGRADFIDALEAFRPDVILSDYKMPAFDGMAALTLALERVPDTPFIVVTGSMNEETAVECMKAGAWDYVIKEHLRRLGPAVLRVLEQKRRRLERKEMERAIQESEAKFRTLVENIPQKIFLKDRHGRFLSVNGNFARDLGRRPEEIVGNTDSDFYPKELADKYRADDERVLRTGRSEELEERHSVGGQILWVHLVKTPVRNAQGEFVGVFGIFWDITARKRAEDELRQRCVELERFNQVTVGREMRMVELKKEVNALLRAAGRPEKYEVSEGEVC